MLERVRTEHQRLDEATSSLVREITNLAATMKVLERTDDRAVRDAFEATAETLEALQSFLETVADAAGDETVAFDDLGSRLRELEPIASPELGPTPTPAESEGDSSDDEPENPFEEVTPLRRLSAPYSVLLNLERDLYAERIRRPFRIRKLKEIWGDLSRAGSSHPSEGLVARLSRIAEYFDGPSGGEKPGAPWSERDRRIVEELTQRAEAVADRDPEEFRERERSEWVERVEDWVETAEEEPESVGHMEEMLTRFLIDLPARRTPDVRMLLERISELEQLPSSVRERTEEILDDW